MKKLIYVLALLVVAAMGVTACHNNDDDVELTSQCYISSFKLGSVKRTMHTTSSLGVDSTYTTTISASTLRMAIDHRAGTITNVDLLLRGAQLEKVPVTVTALGTVVYASAADTSSWKVYSSKDTVDFTQPVIFRVLANDGSGYRDYTATLQVREDEAEGYTWKQLDNISGMANMTSARLVATGSEPFLFTSDANGQCYYGSLVFLKEYMGMPTSWQLSPCEGLDADCDVTTTVSYSNRFWMSSASGKLFVAYGPAFCGNSPAGSYWQEVAQPQKVRLVAASETALYGVIRTEDGYTMVTSTDGESWSPMAVEGAGFNAPLAGLAYTQTNGNHRVLMLADAYDDTTDAPLFSWSLLEGSGEAWILFNDNNSKYALPRWQHPLLLTYNNWLMAMGASDRSGKHKTMYDIFISHDNGLNWKEDSYLSVPLALRGTTAPITATAYGEYVWIIAGSQQWLLRYNSYGEGQ